MTAPGVYTPSQTQAQEELVEVVARALESHNDEICHTSWRSFATAAINAIREWERR